jgi:hypothetical protein
MHIFIAVALIAASACGGEDSQPSGPVKPVWIGTELHAGKNQVIFRLGTAEQPLALEARFDLRKGAELEVGGVAATPTKSGMGTLTVDVSAKLGALAVRKVFSGDPVELGVPVVLRVAGAPAIEEKLPPMSLDIALLQAFVTVGAGPSLMFAGEPADDGKVTSAALVEPSGVNRMQVIGVAEKLGELDWIAVTERTTTDRTAMCARADGSGDVEVKQVDSHVRIHDRRTGKLVHETVIAPPEPCPSVAYVSDDKATDGVSLDAVRAWVQAQLDAAT